MQCASLWKYRKLLKNYRSERTVVPRIKMIGLDLDGTLLNTRKELTERSREALRKAIDQGVLVLVATGRPYTGIPEDQETSRGSDMH